MAIFRIAVTALYWWWIPEQMNRHFPIGTKTAVQTNALPDLVVLPEICDFILLGCHWHSETWPATWALIIVSARYVYIIHSVGGRIETNFVGYVLLLLQSVDRWMDPLRQLDASMYYDGSCDFRLQFSEAPSPSVDVEEAEKSCIWL